MHDNQCGPRQWDVHVEGDLYPSQPNTRQNHARERSDMTNRGGEPSTWPRCLIPTCAFDPARHVVIHVRVSFDVVFDAIDDVWLVVRDGLVPCQQKFTIDGLCTIQPELHTKSVLENVSVCICGISWTSSRVRLSNEPYPQAQGQQWTQDPLGTPRALPNLSGI
jgi:hypothetical protein